MDTDTVASQMDAQTATNTSVSARQLYQHDPFLALLKDRFRLSNLWISIGSMAFPAVVFSIWWLTWVSRGHAVTSGDIVSVLLQIFVLFSSIFLIYAAVPASIAHLFNTLKGNGTIGESRSQETYETFMQHTVSWIDNGWWTVAILAIVVGYLLYRLLLLEPTSQSPLPYWIRLIVLLSYGPMMYAAGMSVARLLLTLILTNYLFTHFKLQIKPLHPDGTGGLAILGRLLWLCVSIMLWVALLIGIGVISQNLARLSTSEIVLLGAVYLTLTPALLLGWLIFPHRMMVKAREEMLQPLTEEYQRTLMQSLRTSASDPRSVVAETRRLVALKQRYDLVRDSFPTWPLETSAVSRIGVTVLLPLLFPLITELFPLAFHALGL